MLWASADRLTKGCDLEVDGGIDTAAALLDTTRLGRLTAIENILLDWGIWGVIRSETGIKGIVIVSAGFREVGEDGRKIEDEIVAKCRQAGIRMMAHRQSDRAACG